MVDPERFLHHPVRPQRRDQQVGADVAGDDQRQGAEDGPEAAAGEVGADRQPADRQRDRNRGDDHRRGQRRRPQQRRQRPRGERGFQRGGEIAEDDDRQVGRRQDRREADESPGAEEPDRGGSRPEHYSAPLSCISSIVPWISFRSTRLESETGILLTGTLSEGSGLAPLASGYSFELEVKNCCDLSESSERTKAKASGLRSLDSSTPTLVSSISEPSPPGGK